MTSETLAIIYGLAAAAVWGTGDFAGGLATKRIEANRVVMLAHCVGFTFFVVLALLFGEEIPGGQDLLYGALAGLAGMVGLLALYRGLAENEMGITAPLAAMVTAVIPIMVGFINEGLPESLQMVGLGLGLVSVWFLAGFGEGGGIRWREMTLPVVAGIGFALFLVLIDRVSEGSLFWPLAASRIASVGCLLFVTQLRTSKVATYRIGFLGFRLWLLVAMTGLFDAGGNALIVLAAQTGRLDITAILSSMYPASTVFLAWLILGEKLTVPQTLGALLALVSVILIAI